MVTQPVTNAVRVDAAFIQGVIDGSLNAVASIDAARAAWDAAKGAVLPALITKLAGVPAVTEAAWLEHWAKPYQASYVAKLMASHAGEADYTEAKADFAARSPVSKYKVAVIALTNGVEPLPSASFDTFVPMARTACKMRGLIKGEVKAPKETASGGKAGKSPANAAKAAKTVEEHALAFAMNDKAFAAKLILVAADYRPQFEQWFDMLMSMQAAAKA